jgi:hypothetical protein
MRAVRKQRLTAPGVTGNRNRPKNHTAMTRAKHQYGWNTRWLHFMPSDDHDNPRHVSHRYDYHSTKSTLLTAPRCSSASDGNGPKSKQNNKMKRGARPAPSPTILFTKQEQAVSSHPSTIFIFLFGQAPITGHPRASYRETGLQRPGRSRANTASPATPGHHAYARTHTDIYTHTDWSQTNRMQRQDETRQILDKTKRGAAPARQRIQWW